jgi:8-oxo-dGTP diphosphatase
MPAGFLPTGKEQRMPTDTPYSAPPGIPDELKYYPGVSVAILHEGRFLLVRRGHEPSKGLYAFPGGRVHDGESDEAAVRRELLEETGLQVESLSPLEELLLPPAPNADYPAFRLLVFRGYGPAGTTLAGDDAAEAGWFTLDEMEGLPIVPSVLATARAIVAGAA